MTADLNSRFPPYVRWTDRIEVVSQEGAVAEAITADQAVFLAARLLEAALVVRRGEQCPQSISTSSDPT